MATTTIKNYLSLVKFSHTIFAMPFALIGFFLGAYWYPSEQMRIQAMKTRSSWSVYVVPNWTILIWVIVCMVTARSAAMAFNRYLDRHFDAKNSRTAIREIPSGIISKESALRFVILNCIIFVASTYFINKLCLLLSPIALFVILFYSYTKRFTALCHLVLGVGLSLAPIGAFLAVTGQFKLLPIMFSLTVLFWVSGFDIIYALQDEEFDKTQKLHSIPAALGKTKALNVSILLHLLSALCIVGAGVLGHFNLLYWIGITVFIGMLIYQHSIVKPHDLSRVNIAFMTANGIASVIFALFVILDIFLNHNGRSWFRL